jgi:formylglycine-generating enzyme
MSTPAACGFFRRIDADQSDARFRPAQGWANLDYYAQLAKTGGVTTNPKGPDSAFDPSEPNEKKRVHRGGSFLCNDQYCSRYIVGTRGKGEVNTGTNHLGFRCVKDNVDNNVAR